MAIDRSHTRKNYDFCSNFERSAKEAKILTSPLELPSPDEVLPTCSCSEVDDGIL